MFNKKKPEDEKGTLKTPIARNVAEPAPIRQAKPLASSVAATPYQGKSHFPLTKEIPEKDSKTMGSRLHVGKDIHLKGEITACDRLIVEGKVEASMNSNEIEITESGVFMGEVVIETADISGKFEGSLTASTKLIVRKTGCVSGDIQYGEIEIEPGGEISGRLAKTGEVQPELGLADTILNGKVEKNSDGPSAHH